MLNKLSASRTIDDFLKMSCKFAETLSLTEGRCKEPIAALKAKGFESSVALFGETVFTVVSQPKVNDVTDILGGFGGTLLACNIDNAGARML
jgi:pantoate kinase